MPEGLNFQNLSPAGGLQGEAEMPRRDPHTRHQASPGGRREAIIVGSHFGFAFEDRPTPKGKG